MEVRQGRFRIDAVVGDELVEVQHGPLSAIRDKVRRLLQSHRVRVVKPIVARKLLVMRRKRGGKVVRRRVSPKQGTLLSLFDDLIHFTNRRPHPRPDHRRGGWSKSKSGGVIRATAAAAGDGRAIFWSKTKS